MAKSAEQQHGDEVWEADSSNEGSDVESDAGSTTSERSTTRSVCPPVQRPPATPMVSKPMPAVPKVVAASTAAAMAPARAPVQAAPAAQAAPESGLMGLVAHLRGDNARLREALITAQRETEQLALKAGQEKGTVDFAHLLELVKEFGDNLGSLEPGLDPGAYMEDMPVPPLPTGGHSEPEVFAMNSPRTDYGDDTPMADDCPALAAEDEESEVQRLRRELEAARSEVANLRKELSMPDVSKNCLPANSIAG